MLDAENTRVVCQWISIDTHCVSGAFLGVEGLAVNPTDKTHTSMERTFSWRRGIILKKKKSNKWVSDKGYEAGGRNRVRRLEEPIISYSLVQPPPSTLEEHQAKPAATCSRPDYTQLVRSKQSWKWTLSSCKANPFFTAPLIEGLFSCHCLVLRPVYRGREAALKHKGWSC